MAKHTVILKEDCHRKRAIDIIKSSPAGYVVTIKEPKRSLDQNALFWALLSELSIAKPGGRRETPETWKVLVMHACGHECQFIEGLNSRPLPVGFASSKLSVSEMSDLIEWVYAYGAEQGIVFKTPDIRKGYQK